MKTKHQVEILVKLDDEYGQPLGIELTVQADYLKIVEAAVGTQYCSWTTYEIEEFGMDIMTLAKYPQLTSAHIEQALDYAQQEFTKMAETGRLG